MHLGSGYDVILLRQDVHQLSLAFITPLSAQHHSHLGVQGVGTLQAQRMQTARRLDRLPETSSMSCISGAAVCMWGAPFCTHSADPSEATEAPGAHAKAGGLMILLEAYRIMISPMVSLALDVPQQVDRPDR